MTIRGPRSQMTPGAATWRYVAGAGLRSDDNAYMLVRRGWPTDSEPGLGDATEGRAVRLQPRVPLQRAPDPDTSTRRRAERGHRPLARVAPGGRAQAPDAAHLAVHRTVSRRRQLRPPGRGRAPPHPRPATGLGAHLLVVASRPTAVDSSRTWCASPPATRPGRSRGLTWSPHSLGGTYTQYAVFSKRLLAQLGNARDNLVVTTLGRRSGRLVRGRGRLLRVWRDVGRHFPLDSERVAPSGYSMDAYGAYRLGVFAFSRRSSPPRAAAGHPLTHRSTPTTAASSSTRTRTRCSRTCAGAVSQLGGDAGRARALGGCVRATAPLRPPRPVQAAVVVPGRALHARPARPVGRGSSLPRRRAGEARPEPRELCALPVQPQRELGLVHNHASWASRLVARQRSGDPGNDPARAELDARSLAFGQGHRGRRA